MKKAQVAQIKKGIRDNVRVVDGVNVISEILDLDGGSIKDLCFQLKGEMDNLFAVIGGKADGKATLSVVISDDLAKERSLHAGNLVREAAPLIKGGGGGQPFFATAGGKDSGGLSAAIDKVKEITALN